LTRSVLCLMVARAVLIIDRTHAPQLPALYVARFRIEPAQIISATRTSEVDRDSKARKIVERPQKEVCAVRTSFASAMNAESAR
jgi:hypothetical protein